MLDLEFWNFRSIFLRICFLSVATFFLKIWLCICVLNMFQKVLTYIIIYISSFQNGLNHAQRVYISRAKLWKIVVKYKIAVFLTSVFFSNCAFLRLRHFISPTTNIINSIFSVVLCIYKINVFDEAFSSKQLLQW